MAQSKALAAFLVIPTAFFIFALPAHANEMPAGFAPGQVWLSDSSPVAGSLVRIFTVVYDGSPTAIEGSVSFKVDGVSIGSAPFSLNAGESAIESVTWTATEGSHIVSAEITSAIDKRTKMVARISQATSSTQTFSVGPVPPKTAAVEALDSAHVAVASSSPIVASVVAATTATTESIRKAGEAYLSNLAGETTRASSTKPTGSVLGAETEATDSIEETSYVQKAAQTVLPVFRYPALFYPVFAFLILFLLWVLAKRLRNPKRR